MGHVLVLQYVSKSADDIYVFFFSQSNIIFIVWWVFSLFYLVFFSFIIYLFIASNSSVIFEKPNDLCVNYD